MAGAIIGSAVISGGASLLAGGAQADAAESAAGLQAEATRQSIEEQRRQFDLVRGDLAPYRRTGTNALAQYAALYGIGGGVRIPGVAGGEGDDVLAGDTTGRQAELEARLAELNAEFEQFGHSQARKIEVHTILAQLGRPHNANLVPAGTTPISEESPAFLSTEEMDAARERFKETPGYTFRFDEGIRALDRSASATGRLRGGGYTRELTRYGQGVASGEFENYANRLSGLAGMGQGTTIATGTLGVQTGANISNALMAGARGQGNAVMSAGTARASGYAGVANAVGGGVNNYLLYNLLQRGGFPWGSGMAGMT